MQSSEFTQAKRNAKFIWTDFNRNLVCFKTIGDATTPASPIYSEGYKALALRAKENGAEIVDPKLLLQVRTVAVCTLRFALRCVPIYTVSRFASHSASRFDFLCIPLCVALCCVAFRFAFRCFA
jgi:hypothetical protein